MVAIGAAAAACPIHQSHLDAGVGVADDRGRIVRKHAQHRREVAEIAVDDAKQRDDRRLVRRDAVEVRFVDYRFLKSISFRM